MSEQISGTEDTMLQDSPIHETSKSKTPLEDAQQAATEGYQAGVTETMQNAGAVGYRLGRNDMRNLLFDGRSAKDRRALLRASLSFKAS